MHNCEVSFIIFETLVLQLLALSHTVDFSQQISVFGTRGDFLEFYHGVSSQFGEEVEGASTRIGSAHAVYLIIVTIWLVILVVAHVHDDRVVVAGPGRVKYFEVDVTLHAGGHGTLVFH